MKIIFVGDSMGLPREGCEYEDTYFYKFQKEYKEIDCISFFKRAMTSDGLYELYESYIRHYNPDIVISHSGLTDCAPRLINDRKYFWRGLIYVSKRLGRLNLFWLIIKKIFERNDPKRAYISVNEFRKNYIAFTETLINIGVKKIVYIKISPCGQNVVRKSPLLNDNVAKYNKVFDEIKNKFPKQVEVIFPLENATDLDYIDGMHANAKGHARFFNEIKMVLKDIL